MTVSSQELKKMIDSLDNSKKSNVYDYIQFLIYKDQLNKKAWDEIDSREPEPASDHDREMLNKKNPDYMDIKDFRDEIGI